jgi:hypothetical protein
MRLRVIFGLMALVLLTGRAHAQSRAGFTPFPDFIAGVRTASAGALQDTGAFEEMRQHILTMYQGVEVTHSFVLDSHHFDCVPIRQQPSVRLLGLTSIASPPPSAIATTVGADDGADGTVSPESQFDDSALRDPFGNPVRCEAGSIPMRRIALEDMRRFATLRQYFEKSPDESVPGAGPAAASHKYSYTYQSVNSLGGSSNLNLWSPAVNTARGEVFSLSQEWYIGGSGSKTQTAEVGWQNFPAMYGSENSALFIYWTADDYGTTGCYNLTCPGFVQTDNSWTFGSTFPHYSVLGGAQYEFSAEYSLHGGDWWLALGGTWVGYFPGSIYRGGQLTRHAQLIEFGSESVGSTVWPPEGSGQWADAGAKYAAYQRKLFYIRPSTGTNAPDKLTAEQPSPACYSIAGPSQKTGWGVYFYLGGPGGAGC